MSSAKALATLAPVKALATLASVAAVVCCLFAFGWVGLALLGYWLRYRNGPGKPGLWLSREERESAGQVDTSEGAQPRRTVMSAFKASQRAFRNS